MNKMEVFTKKVGGKYCTHFKYRNQTFRLSGFDTKEEAEYQEDQLKACFSNYGLFISRNIKNQLMNESIKKLHKMMDDINEH